MERQKKGEDGTTLRRVPNASSRIRKSIFISILAALLSTVPLHAQDRLDSAVLRAVVRIETAPPSPDKPNDYEIGTGFLVQKTIGASTETFLVTNKHMIGDWNPLDRDIQKFHPWINVFFYRNGDPSGQSFRPTRIDILNPDSTLKATKVHLHPTNAIDVVAIDVTDVVSNKDEHVALVAADETFFVRFDHIKTFLTDIADPVIALGYPLGIRSLLDDYPLAKTGYLASIPGQAISIPFPALGRSGQKGQQTVDGKFLIVDGLIVPGNSGGPVVLVGGMRMRQDPQTHQTEFTNQPLRNNIIGMVSSGLGPSGLTVVVSSDYILDLIDSVANGTWSNPFQ